jgi:hypothetical protein
LPKDIEKLRTKTGTFDTLSRTVADALFAYRESMEDSDLDEREIVKRMKVAVEKVLEGDFMSAWSSSPSCELFRTSLRLPV